MNKVIVSVFKDTGKMYEVIEFDTESKVFDWQSVYQEFLDEYPHYKDNNMTITITNDKGEFNERLILKS